MKRHGSPMIGFILLGAFVASWMANAVDSAKVKTLLAHPPREYATAPLWVWNDLLTEQQIRDTMRDLASQKVMQVFVHPRPGLMTPYLGQDWFRLWNVALDEAKKLDMNVWIYDENSYPSGFAGGWVPELMPESRGRGLALREVKPAPKWEEDFVAVYRLDGDQAENVSAKLKAGESLGEGRYLAASVQRPQNQGWYGGRCYVDLLYPGVTEKFIEVTHEAYRREVGKQFGKRLPGIFTDEPQIRPAGGLPWTDDLPQQFQKRWGYSLLDHLPSLSREMGDWRRVRHNYLQVLNDLFVERWAKPNHDWCEKYGLDWTGHYWDHEWPHCLGVPDNMAMYAWHQRPAIDCLMNQYREDTHAQFGNVRMCRELLSVANQLGRRRTLCEIYGAGGWDLRFEDMKRIADWLGVLGVNTFDEHLSYITLRGARKRDHPQSFSYHEPWWDAYHVSASYVTRLSAALSQGQQINRILVLEPTTTAWMYQGNEAKLRELGDSFFKLLLALDAAQIEYDLVSEDVLARHGSVDGKELRVGQRSYPVVVVPPHTENVNGATADLGEAFLAGGGTVVCLGEPPSRVDGNPTSRIAEAVNEAGWLTAQAEEAPQILRRWSKPDEFSIQRASGDKGLLFHMRRQIDDGELLFLVNSSIESPSAGVIESGLKGVEQWNLYTGGVEPYPFAPTAAGTKADFKLPPSGSLLLFLSKKPIQPAPPVTERITALVATSPTEVRRLAPNVLTLDYVDVTAGGETRQNVYFYQANQFAWQKNGTDRNPWDSAVQFKDELIAKKFPAGSGFEASYRFTIEGAVPKNLAIVIERTDLYTITCNGRKVGAKKGDWWLDKAFGRIHITSAARVGENVVTLKASPFTMFHELEAAYVLGDFALQPASKGFVIVPDRPLAMGTAKQVAGHAINPDGTAWLSGGIGFAQGVADRAPAVVFDLGRPADLNAIRIWNYNEGHTRDHTARGTKGLRVSASANGETFEAALGTFALARAVGAEAPAETLPVNARGVRYVRFDILSNHAGVSFPAAGEPPDSGFVGLAEVQFLTGAEQRVDGVAIHRVSGELASMDRRARHLVDGSGLADVSAMNGWNRQGHPFYAHGVAYRQNFHVAKLQGRYRVALGAWRGAVAKVLVNGKLAGHITAPPWDCEVTKALQRGENTIEVVVIGTLKNTLGPHHGNQPLGSAWPGMFQNGPKDGPPPGAGYSNVGYGLFEPFVVQQVAHEPIAKAKPQ
ncbi:MAG: glycosyl hydrolase [Verrucomicrobiota bacterium]